MAASRESAQRYVFMLCYSTGCQHRVHAFRISFILSATTWRNINRSFNRLYQCKTTSWFVA